MIVVSFCKSAVLRWFEQPRQIGKAVRFGGLYRLGMKGVVMARSKSQRWRRVQTVQLACQRRDGIMITVALDGVSETVGGFGNDGCGGVIAARSDFEVA